MVNFKVGEQEYELQLHFSTLVEVEKHFDAPLIDVLAQDRTLEVAGNLFVAALMACYEGMTEESAYSLLDEFIQDGDSLTGQIESLYFIVNELFGVYESEEGEEEEVEDTEEPHAPVTNEDVQEERKEPVLKKLPIGAGWI